MLVEQNHQSQQAVAEQHTAARAQQARDIEDGSWYSCYEDGSN